MNPKISEEDFKLELNNRINAGDDLEKACDDENHTLLHFAAVRGYTDSVSLLLEAGACVDPVSILLETGPSVDPVTFDNDTPLNMAAHFGHTDVVEILLKNGANVNFLSNDGITPLLDACTSGNIETVKAILNYKPDINQPDNKGQNALTVSLVQNHDEIANYLLQTNIDIDTFDLIRNTPLSYAALFGSSSCVEALCKKGADVQTRDISRNTPLHNAIGSGSLETIQILMSHGADLNAKNIEGETPFIKAVLLNNEQIVDYLCSNISKGTFKNLKVNDICPCASGKKYKKCCLNASVEDIAVKFSSAHPPKYDSIEELLEDQIEKADWSFKAKKENVLLGLTPNYYQGYVPESSVYLTSEKNLGIFLDDVELHEPSDLLDSDSPKDVVLLISTIALPQPHEFEDSVTNMVNILNELTLFTKTFIKHDNGILSFINITPIQSVLELGVTLQFLIARNTGYHIRTIKGFSRLMITGDLLRSDWETLEDEFREDVKTSRLFKEEFETVFGKS